MEKIVIFGASGNVGLYLIQYLLDNVDRTKYEIVASGKRKTDFFDQFGIKYYSVDISNEKDFDKLPQCDIHSVIMLSGILPAYMEDYNPKLYLTVNTMGGFNVLEYCRKSNANRIIYAQSISDILGHISNDKLLHPYMERNMRMTGDHAMYIISKNAVVDMMAHYNQQYGLNTITIRLPNIYMYTKSPDYYVDGVIKKMSYRILYDKAINGEDIEVWGDCSQEKDVLYVDDLAQMIEKSIYVDKTYAIYNAGTGIGTSLDDQIKGIVEVFCSVDKKSKIIYRPEMPSGNEYVMDISNAVDELDYKPKYNYIQYLQAFKAEMENNQFVSIDKSIVK